MPRTNRYIESGKPYELCLRVKEGLPFPCLLFIKLLLQSAMAQAAGGRRVSICHYVWMGNHLHILIVVRDGYQAVKFYGELQKRLTDYMKRVLNIRRLTLWEGRPMVGRVLSVDTAISRISYFYANPARANLIDRIDDYPGLTSWEFLLNADKVDSEFHVIAPRIKAPAVHKVGARSISKREDRALTEALYASTTRTVTMHIEPNAWMYCFNVEEGQVPSLNATCVTRIREQEEEARTARNARGRRPLGAALLREARIMRPHTPKKKERKIFAVCTDKETRMLFIQKVKTLQQYCRKLFEKKLFHLWPPGMFLPPRGILASAVELG